MKNRAKCKLCGDVIESFHDQDHVICKCGEIECYGGASLRCAARDFNNFVRVDDEGNEIVVEFIMDVKRAGGMADSAVSIPNVKPLYIIENLIESYKRLPQNAMNQPVSNSDLVSVLESLREVFRAF